MALDFAPDHWAPFHRLVAVALAERMNRQHQAWPSLRDLCPADGPAQARCTGTCRMRRGGRIDQETTDSAQAVAVDNLCPTCGHGASGSSSAYPQCPGEGGHP